MTPEPVDVTLQTSNSAVELVYVLYLPDLALDDLSWDDI